ncbi:MAG: AAA family ATPase [Gammaproteobacteria bacterium AqS3]|nr:AAA family ATPase [Gammaproteobacteria bacterium AqS3]
MARIEGLRIKNFKVLREVALGRLSSRHNRPPLTEVTVVIGHNGTGKSALFDAFGFLADCLKLGVEDACDARGRGGFSSIRSKGQGGPIEFEIHYRESAKSRPITYELSIDVDAGGRPYVLRERLRQRRKGQSNGRPFSFLILNRGRGVAWTGDLDGVKLCEADESLDLPQLLEKIRTEAGEVGETEQVELDDIRRLGIVTLGALRQHPRIAQLRRFIEGWYLSCFTPDAARSRPLAGPQRRLNARGDNLANVVQFMSREHGESFKRVIERTAEKIPGIDQISTEKTQDGRLLLKFYGKGFKEPLCANQVSDGTLKLFAYMLLIEDPDPPLFFCIENPESGLYHKLFLPLMYEFRDHLCRPQDGSQMFFTTHQPYFLDAVDPEEVWMLEKDDDGLSSARWIGEDPLVCALVEQELPLGGLWYSDYLDKKSPVAP